MVDRLVAVEYDDGLESYNDIVAFIDTIEDDAVVDQLTRARRGRGAFRRFKDAAARCGVLDSYFAFSEERAKARAREWFAEQGVDVTDTSPSVSK